MAGITLSIGPYTLPITLFERGAYPRTVTQWVTISESARGNSIRRNTAFRPKYLWTFTCALSVAEIKTLKRMVAYYEANRGPWGLEDFTDEFEESTPRTRALATGATEDSDGMTVLYYARFNAEPVQFPQLSELNIAGDRVALQFRETEATTA